MGSGAGREFLEGRCDRRTLLKGGLGGAALLGLGGLLPAGCRSYPQPPATVRFFNAREYATLNAVAERLLAAAGEIGAGGIDVAARVDGLVAQWDDDAKNQLRLMLRVFEHGTYLFDLRRRRFTRLPAPQQDGYLTGWMNSTLGARRLVFRTFKALVSAGFFQEPSTWPAIGYDGPWLGRRAASVRVEPEATVAVSALPRRGAP